MPEAQVINPNDILEGWNAISKFLNVSDRTAMKYYKLNGLPINFNRAGHPVGIKPELTEWRIGKAA
jgi:hypothetical protein